MEFVTHDGFLAPFSVTAFGAKGLITIKDVLSQKGKVAIQRRSVHGHSSDQGEWHRM